MFQVSILRDTLRLYGTSPLSVDYLRALGVPNFPKLHPRCQSLIWLGSLYNLPPAQMKKIWTDHKKLYLLNDSQIGEIHETANTQHPEKSIVDKRENQTDVSNIQSLQNQIGNLTKAHG